MRTLLLLACVAGSFLDIFAQSEFVINGSTGNLIEGKKVYLIKPDISDRPADSTVVRNGGFQFKGEVDVPMFAYIAAQGGGGVNMILEGGTIQVSLAEATSSGAPLNDKWNAFQKQITPLNKQMFAIQQQARDMLAQGDSTQLEHLQKEIDTAYEKAQALSKAFIFDNLDNVLPAPLLTHFMRSFSDEEKERIFSTASPSLKANRIFRQLVQEREAKFNTQPGKMFTDFTMNDLEGKEVSLSHYVGKGKYVLVDFWASWCGPCRAEMPKVKAVYAKYKDKGFDVVGVSLDSSKEAWSKAVNDLALPWPQLSDLKGTESIAAVLYGIKSIPFTLLIAPDGTILADKLRGDGIEEALGKYLK